MCIFRMDEATHDVEWEISAVCTMNLKAIEWEVSAVCTMNLKAIE